jgi:nicotinamide-nucleotide amidase
MTQNSNLAAEAGRILIAQNLMVCAAESCTGGLLMSTLTDIPGSSAYVMGGVVTYSNAIKERLIHVPHRTLMSHGAVSEPTARDMAAGVRDLFGADVALSITGIAGPGGGTDDKPVGLTYIGITSDSGLEVRQFIWEEDRATNKALSVEAALSLLIEHLSD